jgi:hypothetical protein
LFSVSTLAADVVTGGGASAVKAGVRAASIAARVSAKLGTSLAHNSYRTMRVLGHVANSGIRNIASLARANVPEYMINATIRTGDIVSEATKQFYRNLGDYGRLNDIYQLVPKGGIALVKTAGQTTQKMKLLIYAENAFKRSLDYYKKRGITDPSALGQKAGRRAENMVLRWANKHGYNSVRVGDVQLGIGKFSSDAKWSPGKIIFDFKKSKSAIRATQSSVFKLFAQQSGYQVFYIFGE